MFYGLANKRNVVELAQVVCDCLGHGSTGKGVPMLVETCAAETLLGEAVDSTLYAAGAGVSQVDEGTFDWLKSKYKDHFIAAKIKQAFNVDLSRIHYRELDFSPLLSLIFCRLRYWTVPEPIPETRPERAAYWKEHYNTVAGKGTSDEYLQRCISSGVTRYLPGDNK